MRSVHAGKVENIGAAQGRDRRSCEARRALQAGLARCRSRGVKSDDLQLRAIHQDEIETCRRQAVIQFQSSASIRAYGVSANCGNGRGRGAR